MKIAFISQPWNDVHIPPVFYSSITIWTYEVARRLVPNCDVIVYAKRGQCQKKIECYEGIYFHRMSITPDKWLLRFLNKFLKFRDVKRPLFASSLYYLGYILQVSNDLRSQKCDIVQIFNFSQFVPLIRIFNPDIKIVLNMHCEWLTQLDRTMIQRRLERVDLVIGCSEYITNKIRNSFPQFSQRCSTAFNGIDIDNFSRKDNLETPKKNDSKRLLFVGRISPEKGVHVLLDALQEVIKRYPLVHLEIVGPEGSAPSEFIVALSNDARISGLASFYGSSYSAYLRERLITLNIANHVTFTGYVPNLQVIDYYCNADVLINPSFSESFGRSLIEAMACKMPVVATRVGGMSEIIEDGKTGTLVEPGDAQSLAEAIICLLSDENLRKSMGEAGRKRVVELFSWEKISKDLLYMYNNIC